jgi:hypothetical protein
MIRSRRKETENPNMIAARLVFTVRSQHQIHLERAKCQFDNG